MKKVYIGADEWYPVWFMSLDEKGVEIPDEFFAEYEEVVEKFMAMQVKIEAYYDEHK